MATFVQMKCHTNLFRTKYMVHPIQFFHAWEYGCKWLIYVQ